MDEESVTTNIKGPFPNQLFLSCASDPKGSVHRAWSVSLVFIIIFAIVAIFEAFTLKNGGASLALILAAVSTAIVQLSMAIIGTFILKRFSTSFSVGFFCGLVLVVAQQNLLLSVTFWNGQHGSDTANAAFANFAFALFAIYCIFGAILAQFRNHVMVALVDTKGVKATDKSEKAPSDSVSDI